MRADYHGARAPRQGGRRTPRETHGASLDNVAPMASRGVHFAITDDERDALLECDDDDDLEEVVGEIEERWDEAFLFETDKAWDAIHRALTDGTLDTEEEGETDALSLAVLGGRFLNEGDDGFVALVDGADLRRVADALAGVTEAELRRRYFDTPFPDYGEKSEEDFTYTWASFDGLAAFFARAADAERHVIFTVSQ